MTTIAWRDGNLAADSLVSYSTYTNGDVDKLARTKHHYVALAGPRYIRVMLEEWLDAGADDTVVPEALMAARNEFSALIMDDQGRVFEFDNGFLLQVHANYTAIGSGAMMAMGAMAHGASAMEAVAAACKHDKGSGGSINFAHFSDLLN